MVHSPMYQRLMRFVEDAKANEALADYDSKHRSTLEAMREAEEYIRHFREHQGFQGQTGDAIDNWLERAERRLERWRSSYLATTQVEVEMRRVMQQAREEAEMLSPVLVDARLDKLRDVAEVTIPVMEQYGLVGKAFNAVASTGAAVYDAIAAQANNEREVSSTAILERLNHSMDALAAHASLINQAQQHLAEAGTRDSQVTIPQGPSTPSVADQLEQGYKGVSLHDPGVYPGNRDTDYGRSDGRGPNSGLYPNGFDNPTSQDADAEKLRKLQSGRIPDRFNSESEPGSRSKPITDPEDLMGIDLLHTRIGGERYANGTVGGYTPAPPSDRYHPLWNINGGPPPTSTPPGVRAMRARVPSALVFSVRVPSAPPPSVRAAHLVWVRERAAHWVAVAQVDLVPRAVRVLAASVHPVAVAQAPAASAGYARVQLPEAALAPTAWLAAQAHRVVRPASRAPRASMDRLKPLVRRAAVALLAVRALPAGRVWAASWARVPARVPAAARTIRRGVDTSTRPSSSKTMTKTVCLPATSIRCRRPTARTRT